MSEWFYRSRFALRMLVTYLQFQALSVCRNKNARLAREGKFVKPVQCLDLGVNVRKVHGILLLLRRYLRIFDCDDATLWEVMPFTI